MITSTDRAWFKKNRGRNTRLRLPGPGEVAEIMRRSLPSTAYEIAVRDGEIPTPDPDMKWAVAIISVDHETMIRMLVLRPKDWSENDTFVDDGFAAATMMFGSNVVFDKIRG